MVNKYWGPAVWRWCDAGDIQQYAHILLKLKFSQLEELELFERVVHFRFYRASLENSL
jgi:hypothetical protein